MIPIGNLDAPLKRYYRCISQELPCSRKMKKQIMQHIQDNIVMFLEQNPTADIEAIQTRFGTAKEIASSYIDDQDASELLRKMHIKRKILSIVAGVMATVLLIWGIAVLWAMIDTSDRNDGHIGERVEIVD